MNLLDIILLVLLVPGTIRGISKGLLEQVVTLIGVVLAVYMAYHFSEPVCTWLDQYINVSETALHVVGFIVMLLGVLIIVMCLAKVLTHVADAASLGWLNRALGFVFAIAVSALILFDTLNTKFELVKTPILNESVLYGHLRDLGYFVFPYLKKLLTLGQ